MCTGYKNINPAEIELQAKKVELEKLSSIHREKERVIEELNLALTQFQRRYFVEVGKKQNELERLHTKLAELMARKSPYGQELNQKSSGISTTVAKSEEEKAGATIEKRSKLHTLQELKEAKMVYRKIAAIIHPDKATEGSSLPFRTMLMAALNEAYTRKDIDKMQRILDEWQESPDAVSGEGMNAELERTRRAIVQINRRILEIDTEISRIIVSDMYVMMEKVCEADHEGRDILAEMTNVINAKIEDAKNTLLLRMYG